MIERGRIAEILKGPDHEVLDNLPGMLPELSQSELLDLLDLLERTDIFRDRLPLRIQLYGKIAEHAPQPELRLIALTRLLRRLGARKDVPELGKIPSQTDNFAEYLAKQAIELCEDENLATAVAELAMATLAYRSGDLINMHSTASRGLEALSEIDEWLNPPENPDLWSLALAETGHELTFIAVNAVYRAGDIAKARNITENWAKIIESWESTLGPLPRQRYHYYRLVGNLSSEVGLLEPALDAYSKALEFAPTPYRKAFIWLNEAQIERELGRDKESWDHGVLAIDAFLESPYPQTAAAWIEWLALNADTGEKQMMIEDMRTRLIRSGGLEINRVTRAMTELYRVLAVLHSTDNPAEISPTLDKLINELESAGSWPNLVTILATKAVIAGRIDDRGAMQDTIDRARELISDKLAPEARPPAEFLLESAHALALRNVGAYDEAFNALFDRALEARSKYPGGVGPDEKTALEAIYYLGALAGYDPNTIEKKIRDTIRI